MRGKLVTPYHLDVSDRFEPEAVPSQTLCSSKPQAVLMSLSELAVRAPVCVQQLALFAGSLAAVIYEMVYLCTAHGALS